MSVVAVIVEDSIPIVQKVQLIVVHYMEQNRKLVIRCAEVRR